MAYFCLLDREGKTRKGEEGTKGEGGTKGVKRGGGGGGWHRVAPRPPFGLLAFVVFIY